MSDKPKKGEIHLDAASLKAFGRKAITSFSRYGAILFFVLIAGIYGFVILRINMLANAQPSQSEIDAQAAAAPVPSINPQVAQQLQKLEDNSVNVQTLFDQARSNPFQ
jgi:hypothetical protein